MMAPHLGQICKDAERGLLVERSTYPLVRLFHLSLQLDQSLKSLEYLRNVCSGILNAQGHEQSEIYHS